MANASTHAPARRYVVETDFEPHSDAQASILRATELEIDVTCGRRFGKTKGLIAWLTGAFEGARWGALHAPGGRFWYTAPTLRPACKDFYRELKRALRDLVKWKNDTDLAVGLFNDAIIECKTLEDADNLRGPGLDGLAIDEKGTVSAYAWDEVLSPMLADPPERCERRVMRVGTPRGKRHWTYREHLLGMQGPRGPGGRVAFQFPTWTRPGMAEYCAKKKLSMPENAYRQEYGAEFLDFAAGYFDSIAEAHDGKPLPEKAEQGALYAAGFDFAHVADWSVVVVVQGKPRPMRVVAMLRFGRRPWSETKARGVAAFREWGAEALIDATPAGAPGDVTVEAFKPEWTKISGYDFREGGGREELLQNLAIMLSTGELTLPGTYDKPAFPVLTAELEGFQYEITANGRARARAGPGLQDDCVMALALAAWKAKHGLSEGGYASARKFW